LRTWKKKNYGLKTSSINTWKRKQLS